MQKKKKIETYIFFFAIVFAVQLVNFFISLQGILEIYDKYQTPPWVFPIHWLIPIWTLLYTLVAITGAMIWTAPYSQTRTFAKGAWISQLTFTLVWPFCLFYIPVHILTPISISLIFISLIATMFYSFLIRPLAALLAVPYLLMVIYNMLFHWVFFILNLAP